MIAFFRKIRHNLLRENKVSRYLLYALGEIILVMVGILLAMHINNLNEESKNRGRERAYVQSLVADLKQDVTVMKQVIDYNFLKIHGLDSLSAFHRRDLSTPVLNDSLHLLFAKYVSNLSMFQRNDRTLQQLESTGDYILLKREVSDSLSLFIQLAGNVEAQGEAYKTSVFNAMDAGFKLIDFNSLIDADYINNGRLTGKHFPPMSEDNQAKKEFFNRVALLKAITANYVNGKLKDHQKLTERLIEFLESRYDL
jgi:hypothetical protein